MTVEAESVGAEGVTGALDLLLGAATTRERVICQVPGALASTPAFRTLVQRYARALAGSIEQNSLCNRLHSLKQRCARWPLRTQDRVQADRFELTHEHLAFMLGVRRPTVTDAMAALQAADIIRCERRRMRIVDRSKLAALACECYAATVKEFNDALTSPTARTT